MQVKTNSCRSESNRVYPISTILSSLQLEVLPLDYGGLSFTILMYDTIL